MLHSLRVHTSALLAQAAACFLLFPRFLLTALMLWLLDFLCIRKKVLHGPGEAGPEAEQGPQRARDGEAPAAGPAPPEPPPDDPPVLVSDSNRLCTLESLKAVWHGQKLDHFKSARVGAPAPNPVVVAPDGPTRRRLLDFARGARPLVLNFGSCTCPPFMVRLRSFQRLAARFLDVADCLLVYIEEAHPSDGWVSSDAPYDIPKHRCLQDRLRAARLMQRGAPGCRLAVDTMDNAASAAYGAYFERLYVVQDARVVYQGGRGPEGYKISELRLWLEQYRLRLRGPGPATAAAAAVLDV
uniref:Iodothyronine deiodinase n=1 Tax=Ornithorhynchus anatinus TaxID=9258 RepID=A0A6I8P1M1_ORNAN